MRLPLFAACVALLPAEGLAHPGGLNAEGCHTNRKTGEYHCHRGGGGSRQTSKRRAVAPEPLGFMDSGASFRNCTEARRAGAAPVRRGEPGYGAHLDRDNDGVGCE